MAGFLSLLRRVYLSLYNWTVCFGWVQVLYFAVKILCCKESGHEQVYDAVERPLQLAQTAAFLEIIHGLIGLVRSPISATLPQIGSRLYVTWGILYSFPEARTHMLVSSLVISWAITEIIRYSFFGLKEVFGSAPSFLQWLRYSTFLVLYPIGIFSEVGLTYIALPYIKAVPTCILTCLVKERRSFQDLREINSLTPLKKEGIEVMFGTSSSDRSLLSQDSSAVILLYPTSAEERDTICCFLDFQDNYCP